MARIPPVPPESAGLLLRFANSYSRRKVGRTVEPVGVMGHNGWILGASGAFEFALERSTSVPGRLKTLAEIKAAMMIGCPF